MNENHNDSEEFNPWSPAWIPPKDPVPGHDPYFEDPYDPDPYK
jgi:hypothetical protein